MEYYSTIKKRNILSFEGRWLELESIMLKIYTRLRKKNPACFFSYEQSKPKRKKKICK
jgi:hypothetical protein